jgi:hypothetical protein
MVPPAAMSADAVLIDPVPAAREHLLGRGGGDAGPGEARRYRGEVVIYGDAEGIGRRAANGGWPDNSGESRWRSPDLKDGGYLDLP